MHWWLVMQIYYFQDGPSGPFLVWGLVLTIGATWNMDKQKKDLNHNISFGIHAQSNAFKRHRLQLFLGSTHCSANSSPGTNGRISVTAMKSKIKPEQCRNTFLLFACWSHIVDCNIFWLARSGKYLCLGVKLPVGSLPTTSRHPAHQNSAGQPWWESSKWLQTVLRCANTSTPKRKRKLSNYNKRS